MTDAKTEIENIQGFRAVTVKVDGSPCEVKVKKLNLYELQTYATVYAQQAQMVELFIGKGKEFVERLDPEECFQIIEIGREINDPILARSGDLDRAMLDTVLTAAGKRLEAQKKLASLSAEWSSKLPSSPAETPAK